MRLNKTLNENAEFLFSILSYATDEKKVQTVLATPVFRHLLDYTFDVNKKYILAPYCTKETEELLKKADAKGECKDFNKDNSCWEHIIPETRNIIYVLIGASLHGELTLELVKRIIEKRLWLAVITPEQNKIISKNGWANDMPNDWNGKDVFSRYEKSGIKLIKNKYCTYEKPFDFEYPDFTDEECKKFDLWKNEIAQIKNKGKGKNKVDNKEKAKSTTKKADNPVSDIVWDYVKKGKVIAETSTGSNFRSTALEALFEDTTSNAKFTHYEINTSKKTIGLNVFWRWAEDSQHNYELMEKIIKYYGKEKISDYTTQKVFGKFETLDEAAKMIKEIIEKEEPKLIESIA